MKSDHSIKNTAEFLGIWESVHNPDFNYGEFATIKSQAGLNAHLFNANGVVPSSPGLPSSDRYPGTPSPAHSNRNAVAPRATPDPPQRAEPRCGSIYLPPIPRVGLIAFGQPWAGGRNPFGIEIMGA